MFLEKVSFANKFPMLLKATADSESPTPGYLFTEINKITWESSAHCLQLLDYLLGRLENKSPHVKLKVLKLIRHIIANGARDFRVSLRKQDKMIKDASNFAGPSDAVCGQNVGAEVRKEAQELLLILYDADCMNEDYEGVQKESSANSEGISFTGLGALKTSSRYEGFGNAPLHPRKSITEKMMDGICGVMDKLLHPADVDNETIKLSLKADCGNYEAVHIDPTSDTLMKNLSYSTPNLPAAADKRIVKKGHQPGRAGGGWDCIAENNSNFRNPCNEKRLLRQPDEAFAYPSSKPSNFSSDSLENLEEPSSSDWFSEEQFIAEVIGIDLPKPSSIIEFQLAAKRCSTLNFDKLMELLNKCLVVGTVASKLRALMLIEVILYQDYAVLDIMDSTFKQTLDMMKENEINPIQLKATKIIFYLEKLLRIQAQMYGTRVESSA